MSRYNRNDSIYDGNAARKVAAPKRRPRRVQEEQKNNVVTISEKDLRRAKFKNLVLPQMAKRIIAITLIFSAAMMMLNGQVELSALSAQLSTKTEYLAELESVEITRSMEINNFSDITELELYVKENLGMEKINSSQIIYVNFAKEDKGEVFVEETPGFFESIFNTIASWLS